MKVYIVERKEHYELLWSPAAHGTPPPVFEFYTSARNRLWELRGAVKQHETKYRIATYIRQEPAPRKASRSGKGKRRG